MTLKPTKDIKEYEKYGFKKCKGSYGRNGCYYLCVAKGCKMIFLSKEMIDIIDWSDSDPRIHKRPNCRYSDTRTALDIVIGLAINGMIMTEYPIIEWEVEE